MKQFSGLNMNCMVVGVIDNNSIYWLSEFLSDAINLNYEEWQRKHPEADPDEDYCENGSETYIKGFKEIENPVDDKIYEPDPEADFSAIIHESTTQVVISKYAKQCEYCSPCYPNQGNLDTSPEYGNTLAYALPPEEVYDDFDSLCKMTGEEISVELENFPTLQGIFCIINRGETFA